MRSDTGNVTIVSPFRDSIPGVWEYVNRVKALDWPSHQLRVIAVEGDSKDDTWAALMDWYIQHEAQVYLVKCDTGRPRYPSIVNADRFNLLAVVFNRGLDAVDMHWTDAVLFLPSDIKFGPKLLRKLWAWDLDAVAPLVFQHNIFYDIWAFSQDGQHWGNFPREHIAQLGERPIEMTSIGGTMLFKADLLRAGVRYSYEDADRGFSRLARAKGFRLWADPTTIVEHGQ